MIEYLLKNANLNDFASGKSYLYNVKVKKNPTETYHHSFSSWKYHQYTNLFFVFTTTIWTQIKLKVLIYYGYGSDSFVHFTKSLLEFIDILIDFVHVKKNLNRDDTNKYFMCI